MHSLPSKTKSITESKTLPFEPNMQDILEVYAYFQNKYDCKPTEVFQEEVGEWETRMVFFRVIDNDNYENEMVEYRMANAAYEREQEEAIKARQLAEDGRLAQAAWKALHRQERISRKHLGRHTIAQLM